MRCSQATVKSIARKPAMAFTLPACSFEEIEDGFFMKQPQKRKTTVGHRRSQSHLHAAEHGSKPAPQHGTSTPDKHTPEKTAAATKRRRPTEAKPPRPKSKSALAVPAKRPAAKTRSPKRTTALTPPQEQPVAEGLGRRFALGPVTPTAPSEPPSAPDRSTILPSSYETGRLMIVPRDPHWLCAQWDASTSQIQLLKSLPKESSVELRVFSGTSGSNLVRKVPIVVPDKLRATWFIEVPRGDEFYTAEIGYVDKRRQWTRITASAIVKTPPEARSPRVAYEVVTVRLEEPLKPTPEEADQPRKTTGKQVEREAGADVLGATIVPLGKIGEQQTERLLDVSALPSSPSAAFGALGEIQGPSSVDVALGRRMPHLEFWLNLNVEVVVYGSTQPGASLSIGGRPFVLRPDGTFSVRLSLPDGTHELALEAVSPDGKQRHAAKLTLHRRTHWDVGTTPPATRR